jgi:general secretion pathway protein B
MSFILDALRKSESERHRGSAPSLSRIPEAVAARRVPRWAAGTIALLGVGVIGLAAALWLSARGSVPVPAAAGTGFEAPAPAPPAASPSGAALPSRGIPDSAAVASDDGPVDTDDGAVLALNHDRTASEGGRIAPRDDRTASAASAPSPASAPAVEPAPAAVASYEAAAASDASLPALNLEFHAFADDPARRFVYINGEKYVEGSRLQAGPRVVRITADGVILEAAGQQLMLARK